MPIYEYECNNCGSLIEVFQDINDKPLKKCKECKKNKLERLISLSSFHLKGNGWYSTDYAKNAGINPTANLDESNTSFNDTSKDSSNGISSSTTSSETKSGNVAPKKNSEGKVTSSKSA